MIIESKLPLVIKKIQTKEFGKSNLLISRSKKLQTDKHVVRVMYKRTTFFLK
jgi:hypothetical protein